MMRLLRLLRANEVARSVFDIDYERLWSQGARALLFDLDNTLGRRGSKSLGDEARRLLADLESRGFRIGILTNRKRRRKNELAQQLAEEFTVLDVARKPHRAGFASVLAHLGQLPAAAAMIGDRRFTDILGANRSGIYSIRVHGFRRKR
jgi:HAD superfamily phosphatase (TIGR01668 family)